MRAESHARPNLCRGLLFRIRFYRELQNPRRLALEDCHCLTIKGNERFDLRLAETVWFAESSCYLDKLLGNIEICVPHN